jgi:hypothetical protein
MRVFEQSPGGWVVVLAACAAVGGALELSFYSEPRFLVTPLVVAVAALLLAFRSHQRSVEAQRINVELQALYEVAAALGSSLGVADSMNVLASKLKAVIPFSTCALFLREGPEGASRCRFAAGTAQAVLSGVAVRAGEGLVGLAIDRRECLARDLGPAPAGAVSADAPARELRSALVCPRVSFRCLRWSRSSISTAVEVPRRLARANSRSRWGKRYLVFGRPVSASVIDSACVRSNTSELSMTAAI